MPIHADDALVLHPDDDIPFDPAGTGLVSTELRAALIEALSLDTTTSFDELPVASTITDDDIMLVVVNPGSAPELKQVSVGTFRSYVQDDTFYGPLYPAPIHAVWAGDPAWANPGDGNAVPSIRNKSGGGDPAQATAGFRPIYRATSGGMNSKPTLQFDGTDDYLDVNIADVAQPHQVLVALRATSLTAVWRAVMTTVATDIGRSLGKTDAGNWYMNYGSSLDSGVAATTDPTVLRFVANGASSAIYINGALAASGAAAAGVLARFSLGAGMNGATPGYFFAGHIGFAGIYDDADNLVPLETAMRTHYGAA